MAQNRNWLVEVGRNGKGPRNRSDHQQRHRPDAACQRGLGIALLPDYLVEDSAWCNCSAKTKISARCFFVYPED